MMREERHPQNDRLSKERVEDLESIIDEFLLKSMKIGR